MNICRATVQKSRGHMLLLALVLFLGIMFLGMMVVCLTYVSTTNQATARFEGNTLALPLAESGIEEGLAHMNACIGRDLATNGWSLQPDGSYRLQRQLGEGHFVVNIRNYNRNGTDLINTLSNTPVIDSVGYMPLGSLGTNQWARRGVRVGVRRDPCFTNAVLTAMGGLFYECLVDSFDPRLGDVPTTNGPVRGNASISTPAQLLRVLVPGEGFVWQVTSPDTGDGWSHYVDYYATYPHYFTSYCARICGTLHTGPGGTLELYDLNVFKYGGFQPMLEMFGVSPIVWPWADEQNLTDSISVGSRDFVNDKFRGFESSSHFRNDCTQTIPPTPSPFYPRASGQPPRFTSRPALANLDGTNVMILENAKYTLDTSLALTNHDYILVRGKAGLHVMPDLWLEMYDDASIRLAPGASLVIYLENQAGLFVGNHARINPQGQSTNLIVYQIGNQRADLWLWQQAEFTGTAYGHCLEFTMGYDWEGAPTFNGAVIGGYARIGGYFHYDETLKSVAPRGGYFTTSWAELSPGELPP
jgi:hypothetical protein